MKEKRNKLVWYFKNYILPYKFRLIFLICLILIATVMENISPYLYGKMLDNISGANFGLFINLIIIYFIITIITASCKGIEDYVGKIVSFKIATKSQEDLFKKIVMFKTVNFEKYKTGELITRLEGDAELVQTFYVDVITSILQIVVNIVVSLYFVISISLTLSTVSLFYIPATFLIVYLSRKKFKKIFAKSKLINDKYYGYIDEVFSNNGGIKAFNIEKFIYKKYKDLIEDKLKILKSSTILENVFEFLNTLITIISSLFIIYVSSLLIKQNLLTIGIMVSFNLYINKLFASVESVFSLNISKQRVMVSLERMTEILFADCESIENTEDISIDVNDVSIDAKDVSFRYDNNIPIVDKLSFKLDKAGFYSFVGKNGCGKSTFAKLLIKLYDIDDGYIKINNIDINDISISNLRKTVVYIQKDDFFFNETIYNNLQIANLDAKKYDIEKACSITGIDKFINSLPNKYETMLGASGVNLSSGQKQQLNIARALLTKARILIFDETSCNLDGEVERNIIELLKSLGKNNIVIFISHKLSSIIQSDKIFVMNNGKIIDSGTHEELLDRNILYRDMFK